MKRSIALALVLVLIVPVGGAAVGGVAAQETGNGTTWSAPGPFDIEELRTGGDHPAEAPPSVRYLGGEKATGAVALRYVPATPFSNDPKMMEPGTTLNGDRVQLYSTIFGEGTGEYEFVVVFWQQETKRVNGTTVTYAANQEVQRASVTLENGYATTDVRLNSHFDDTWRATAWLERDGDRVPGARWTFNHASLPTSQQVQIATQADAWWYAFRTAILPGAAGIILGLSAARMTLRQTGRGPGWGLGAWAIIGAIGVGAGLGGLYYEISVVIANADILMGLSLGVVAYGGGLRMHPTAEKIQFVRKELREAKALRRGTDGPEGDAR